MFSKTLRIVILLLIIAISTIYSLENTIAPNYNNSTSSYHLSLLGSGSAIPSEITGLSLNPATLPIWHQLLAKRVTASAGYQSGSSNIMTIAGSYILDKSNAAALQYSYRNDTLEMSTEKPQYHLVALTYSGLLVSDRTQGDLFVGANINYLYHGDSLKTNPTTVTKKGVTTQSGIKPNIDYQQRVTQEIYGDIGFYQFISKKGEGYSLVFENILGYKFMSNKNPLDTLLKITETKTDTTTIYDTTYSTFYSDTAGVTEDSDALFSDKYKTVLIGVGVTRNLENGMMFNMPIDMRIWGLFDKDMRGKWFDNFKNYLEIGSGFELYFTKNLSARVGYRWSSKSIGINNNQLLFKPSHNIAFGATGRLSVANLDFGYYDDSWSLTLSAGIF